MSENGEIYTAGKNFTLPPAVTAWTNSTSAVGQHYHYWFLHILPSFHGAQEYYLADDLSMVYLCVSCVFVTNN